MEGYHRVNVAILIIDTMSINYTDMKCGRCHLPNLSRWAAGNMFAPHAITPATYTLPALPSILTGLNALHHPVKLRLSGNYRVTSCIPSIFDTFKSAGYTTVSIADSNYVGACFNNRSTDVVYNPTCNPTGSATWNCADISTLGTNVTRKLNTMPTPYFACIHILSAHGPCGSDEYDKYINEYKLISGNSRVVRLGALSDILSIYLNRLTEIDEYVIKPIIEELDDVLLVIMGDHGCSFGIRAIGHGFMSWNNMDTLLAMTYHKPIVYSHPISLIDIFPTVCNIVGINPPDKLDGISMINYIDTNTPTGHYYHTWASNAQCIQHGMDRIIYIDPNIGNRWNYNVDGWRISIHKDVVPDVTIDEGYRCNEEYLEIDDDRVVEYIRWYTEQLESQPYPEVNHTELYDAGRGERGTRLDDGGPKG